MAGIYKKLQSIVEQNKKSVRERMQEVPEELTEMSGTPDNQNGMQEDSEPGETEEIEAGDEKKDKKGIKLGSSEYYRSSSYVMRANAKKNNSKKRTKAFMAGEEITGQVLDSITKDKERKADKREDEPEDKVNPGPEFTAENISLILDDEITSASEKKPVSQEEMTGIKETAIDQTMGQIDTAVKKEADRRRVSLFAQEEEEKKTAPVHRLAAAAPDKTKSRGMEMKHTAKKK